MLSAYTEFTTTATFVHSSGRVYLQRACKCKSLTVWRHVEYSLMVRKHLITTSTMKIVYYRYKSW